VQYILLLLLLLLLLLDTVPAYLNDVSKPLADIPGGSSLRAADRGDQRELSTKTKIDGQSLCIAAPILLQYGIHYPFVCAIKLSANDNFDQG